MSIPSTNFIHSQCITPNVNPLQDSQKLPEKKCTIKAIRNRAQVTETARSIFLQPSCLVPSLKESSIKEQPPKRPAPARPEKASEPKEKSKIPQPTRKAPPRPSERTCIQVRREKRVTFKEENEIFFFDVEEKPEVSRDPICLPTVPPLPPAFIPLHLPLQQSVQSLGQAEDVAPPKPLKLPPGLRPRIAPRLASHALSQVQPCERKLSPKTGEKRKLALITES